MDYNFENCKTEHDYFVILEKALEENSDRICLEFSEKLTEYLQDHTEFEIGDILYTQYGLPKFRIRVKDKSINVDPYNKNIVVHYYGTYVNAKGEDADMPKKLKDFTIRDGLLVINECMASKVKTKI
mgnify:CR=1 FL=1